MDQEGDLYTDGRLDFCPDCGSYLVDGEVVVTAEDIPQGECDSCGATSED